MISIVQGVVSSFQRSGRERSKAFCLGATSLVRGGTGPWERFPLTVVVMIMSRSWMGAKPSFRREMLAVYFSPGLGTLGLKSKVILPGRSAGCVPFLTVTPADSSKPSGALPCLVSWLWATVLPATNDRPIAAWEPPWAAAWDSARAPTALVLPSVARWFCVSA